MNLFLQNLAALLAEKGKNRSWLAKVSGINLSTFHGWYENNRQPRLEDALRIAKALSVSLDFLATGKDPIVYQRPIFKEFCAFLEPYSDEQLHQILGAVHQYVIFARMAPQQK